MKTLLTTLKIGLAVLLLPLLSLAAGCGDEHHRMTYRPAEHRPVYVERREFREPPRPAYRDSERWHSPPQSRYDGPRDRRFDH